MSLNRPLNIFVPHCSDLLTDHLSHGDGLVAYGFIRHLAERGHNLYVAVQDIDLRHPLPSNVHIFPIGLKHKSQFFARLGYMSQVRRLFMRLRKQVAFDVIHQMNPVYTGISLSLLRTGVPTLLGTYVARWPNAVDDGAQPPGSKLAYGFRTCVCALQQCLADRVLLTGPVAANRLVPLGPIKVPRSYLAHGIDTELFSPPAKDGDEKKVSILYLAHLTKRKGILDLISAFVDVLTAHPDCTLLVAGAGPEAGAAHDLAEHLGITGRVKFLGHVDRPSAPAIYRGCSIYCLPSNGEPYATTVIEAMSCGKPIVFTNAGGLPHLVGAHGGIGVDVGDVKGLSRALCSLLADPARRKAMGRHNRQRVLDTMSWERVIARLEEIYIETIDGRRREGDDSTVTATICGPSQEDCA